MKPLLKNRILKGKTTQIKNFWVATVYQNNRKPISFASESESIAKIKAETFFSKLGIYIIEWDNNKTKEEGNE
jgi:hypothetical protein